jgi:hypothetical protein
MLDQTSGNGISVSFNFNFNYFSIFASLICLKTIINFIATRLWHRIKSNKGPGELYGHTAINAFKSMFIFGGERSGNLLRDLWRYHFGKYEFFILMLKNV